MVSLLAWFERTVQLLWGGTGVIPVFVPLTEMLLVDIVLDMEKVERGQPMSLSLKIMAKNLWFNTKFNTRAGKIKWTEKYIFLTALFRMGEKTFFYQCVCVKCRNYKNVEKVAKMRGMEKIIMSNFSARSTQIQHKSDFVQFAIYKKKPRNHYGFKVFLGGE